MSNKFSRHFISLALAYCLSLLFTGSCLAQIATTTSDVDNYNESGFETEQSTSLMMLESDLTECTIYEEQLNFDDYGAVYGADWRGQIFTASDDYDLEYIAFLAARYGNPGTMQVHVRAVDNGLPTGSDLSIGEINANDFTTDLVNGEWYSVTPSSLTLSNGIQYAIIWSCANGNSSNACELFRISSNSGYSGDWVYSFDSGSTWSGVSGRAMTFKTCGFEHTNSTTTEEMTNEQLLQLTDRLDYINVILIVLVVIGIVDILRRFLQLFTHR